MRYACTLSQGIAAVGATLEGSSLALVGGLEGAAAEFRAVG
jgi:hypothetical protein